MIWMEFAVLCHAPSLHMPVVHQVHVVVTVVGDPQDWSPSPGGVLLQVSPTWHSFT